jgi:hypothetical protein
MNEFEAVTTQELDQIDGGHLVCIAIIAILIG